MNLNQHKSTLLVLYKALESDLGLPLDVLLYAYFESSPQSQRHQFTELLEFYLTDDIIIPLDELE